MHDRSTRTTASVGSRSVGSGTSSTRTSPAPWITVARKNLAPSRMGPCCPRSVAGYLGHLVDTQKTRKIAALTGPVETGNARTPQIGRACGWGGSASTRHERDSLPGADRGCLDATARFGPATEIEGECRCLHRAT